MRRRPPLVPPLCYRPRRRRDQTVHVVARVTREWDVGEPRTFFLRNYDASTATPDRMGCMPARPATGAAQLLSPQREQQQQQKGVVEDAALALEQAVLAEAAEER